MNVREHVLRNVETWVMCRVAIAKAIRGQEITTQEAMLARRDIDTRLKTQLAYAIGQGWTCDG